MQQERFTEAILGIFPVTPQIKIGFKQALIHDVLTVVGLLKYAEHIEGLSDWIQNTAGRIESQNLKLLDSVASLVRFSQGLHGYLTKHLAVGDAAHDFALMMDLLEDLNGEELAQVAIESLFDWGIHHDVLPDDLALPTNEAEALEILTIIQKYREEVWQAPPVSINLADLAALLFDPTALHEQFLFAFEYVWHRFYGARWQQDSQQEQVSLRYHLRQNHGTDLESVFHTVTGRYLPENVRDKLPNIRNIWFLPCCHVGAHVIVSTYQDTMWIGYNANLVTDEGVPIDHTPVAALYPYLSALADETRLKIVTYLQVQGERNVGEIADDLHLTISTASRHLKLLARTGILALRRDGTMRYYTLNPQALIDVGQSLQQLGESVLHHQQEQLNM